MFTKRTVFIQILIISSLFLSPIFVQKVSAWMACGKTDPDAQFFPNCGDGSAPDWCRSDSSQPGSGGWLSGPDATSRRFKTSDTNPIWFGVQCFQYLSIEGVGRPGGISPVKMVVNGPNGFYQEQTRWGGTNPFMVQAPYVGNYSATCYASDAWGNLSCNASSDNFTLIPRCRDIAPVAATLTRPANNSTVLMGADVALTYTLNSWGDRCPAPVNTYRVEISPGCTGSWVTNPGGPTKILSSTLVEGQTYCWRVYKSNGFASAMSAEFRFRAIDDRISVDATASGVQADVCGGGFSGQAGVSGVSNPIDFKFDFNTSSANKYREIWLAAVPDNVAFNNCSANVANGVCRYKTTLDIETEALTLQRATASNSFAFKLIIDAAGNVVQALGYNGTSYVPVTSGDINSLGSTLLDFGGATTFNPATGSGNFRIKFNSTLYGKYAFLAAAIITDANGVFKGSYDTVTAGAPYVYKRVNPSSTLPNWGVDLTPPATPATFGTVKYTAADKFQVNWTFTEINSPSLKSFVSRDNTVSTLKDLAASAGFIDFNIPVPDVNNYNSGALKYSDITATNGYVTSVTTGLRTYQDTDPSLQGNYQFYAFLKDAACNQKAVNTSAAVQKPWVMSYNGNISTSKGITGLSVPSSLAQLPANLKGALSVDVLKDLDSVYLSTYGLISGTPNIPLRNQSKLKQYVTGYEDLTIKPPLDSGFIKWYDYLYDLVNKNAPLAVKTVAVSSTLAANTSTSTFVGVPAGTKKHVLINGNLTVNAGVTCDTQTIFFVAGNLATPLDATFPNATLKITPDFKVSSNANGCMFVTKGDILVENGAKVTGTVLLDSATLSSYDQINAALVSDGKLISKKDVSVATQKGDGLAIKGSVVTEDLYLQRDISLNANQFQPAHLFYFDPRYREIFKNDLNYNKYSIREVGYSSSN